jgi:hypothetical protein
MANDVSGGIRAGIGIGGILVIVGILVAIFWSLWLIIIGLVGLVAFNRTRSLVRRPRTRGPRCPRPRGHASGTVG